MINIFLFMVIIYCIVLFILFIKSLTYNSNSINLYLFLFMVRQESKYLTDRNNFTVLIIYDFLNTFSSIQTFVNFIKMYIPRGLIFLFINVSNFHIVYI